jgi:hypothetical protein
MQQDMLREKPGDQGTDQEEERMETICCVHAIEAYLADMTEIPGGFDVVKGIVGEKPDQEIIPGQDSDPEKRQSRRNDDGEKKGSVLIRDDPIHGAFPRVIVKA